MSNNDTILTDDYVADLLAKEANDASIKYSSMGLEAFRSTKPSNKAKPNTRFLGRIIKETTNHNAALLAREAAEAQARLDKLTEAEDKKRRKLNPSASDIRRRQLGDITSILHGRKRRRDGDDQTKGEGKQPQDDGGQESDKKRRKREEERRSHQDKASKTRHDDTLPAPERERHHRRRSERSRSPERKGRKHRDRSPLDSSTEDERRHHSSKSHHRDSRKSDKDRNPDRDRKRDRRDLFAKESPKRKISARDHSSEDDGTKNPRPGRSDRETGGSVKTNSDDSDPLDDFIGPAPPSGKPAVRVRGRGTMRGSAAMDSKFLEDYDPASDVQVDDEAPTASTENWEDAVESFRDRQKWKQQGAQRLRDAGYTEEQIKRWEKGGEKDIDDVRWTKAGGQREWDRGKDDST